MRPTEGNREWRKQTKRKKNALEERRSSRTSRFTNLTFFGGERQREEFQNEKKVDASPQLFPLAHFFLFSKRWPDCESKPIDNQSRAEEYLKDVTIGTNERRRLERLVWKCARLQVNFKVDWTMVSARCTVCVCVLDFWCAKGPVVVVYTVVEGKCVWSKRKKRVQ